MKKYTKEEKDFITNEFGKLSRKEKKIYAESIGRSVDTIAHIRRYYLSKKRKSDEKEILELSRKPIDELVKLRPKSKKEKIVVSQLKTIDRKTATIHMIDGTKVDVHTTSFKINDIKISL